MKRSPSRFTLIEVLVVIAIIAILAGILLPTINIALKKARVARAKTEIASLITSIRMYEAEYDILPFGYSKTVDSKVLSDAEYDSLISFLSNTGTHTGDGNPRKIKMIDVKSEGEYLDPWKQRYHVVLDHNYDDHILQDDVVGMIDSGATLTYSIVIWSEGPDKAADSDPKDDDNSDNVYSIDTNWQKNAGHTPRK